MARKGIGRISMANSAGARIIIIAGHYGAGKTNISVAFALALAKSGKKTVLIDLDTVNPYFRAADSAELLHLAGVRTINPEYANSNVDIPTLPPEIASVFFSDETAIFDVGGDDGAAALGVYEREIKSCGYEMLYVVNMYRPLTAEPKDAVSLMREIESYSRLNFTGVINNSNLGVETTKETIAASLRYADEISDLTGLPVVCTTVVGEDNVPKNAPDAGRVFVMENHTKQLF